MGFSCYKRRIAIISITAIYVLFFLTSARAVYAVIRLCLQNSPAHPVSYSIHARGGSINRYRHRYRDI